MWFGVGPTTGAAWQGYGRPKGALGFGEQGHDRQGRPRGMRPREMHKAKTLYQDAMKTGKTRRGDFRNCERSREQPLRAANKNAGQREEVGGDRRGAYKIRSVSRPPSLGIKQEESGFPATRILKVIELEDVKIVKKKYISFYLSFYFIEISSKETMPLLFPGRQLRLPRPP